MKDEDQTRVIQYTPPPSAPPPPAPQYYAPPPAPRPKNRVWGCFRGCLVIFILGMCAFTGGGTAVGYYFYTQFTAELESHVARLENIEERETFETTRIVDRNGQLLWEIFGEGKRTYVPLDQIPLTLHQATIAVEDDNFYENQGADIPSLIAALFYNLRNPNERPVGASTITQQLVRHLAFDYDERVAVSYDRKAKEIVLAWIMTRDYTKEQILELYLNEIYYGNLAYGTEAAAQTYFGKSAAELSTAEATFLAGLPQAPIELDPYTNFEAAKEKQWIVLNLMASEGYLRADEIAAIYQTPLEFEPQTVSIAAPHFTTYVRQILEEQFGAEQVANGGLRVTTSIDLRYQLLAEEMARQHVAELREAHNLNNAALVAMNPRTGEVLAMLGSVDYNDESIDGRVNVALSPQQPGSSIKTITYAAALSPDPTTGQPRWTAGDLIWDVETEYPGYSPVNYDGAFRGPVRLRAALANSYNIPALLVLQDIGVPAFLEFTQKMGIASFGADASRYGLSITLGGGELTPLELTSAYATLANQGKLASPVTILRVENSKGELLYEFDSNVEQEQVIDPRVAFILSDILADDVARQAAMGRNSPLDLPFPAAVKTGTTNDFRDNWTIGYTPGLAVGVWAGNTDNSPMTNVSGLTGAAPLWNEYMQAIYNNYELLAVLGEGADAAPTEFVPPAGLEQRPLCAIGSAAIGSTTCTGAGQEWFLVADATTPPTPTPLPDAVAWQALDPSVVRVAAVPLPPLPADPTLIVDPNALPAMLYCHFVQGTAVAELPADAAEQVFLKPPRNPESLKAAYEWGEANGIAILPIQTCTEELLNLARDPNAPAVWRITSPKANETLDGVLPIVGTADFRPEDVQFYKFELGMPRADNPNEFDWVTLGETRNTPVINGQMETLYASGLPPGTYILRLILVQWDGNYVGQPYEVAFTIAR